jgi:hypothetical protein
MPHTLQVADIVGGVIALLLIAVVVLAVARRLRLPFPVALVLVGMGLSALAAAYPRVLPALHDLEISSALIFYVFLPTELCGLAQGQPEMLDALRVLVEGDDIGDGLFLTLIVTDDALQCDTHTGASPGSSDG